MPGIDIFSTLIVMAVLLQDSLILVTSESSRRTLFAVFLRLWKTAFLSKKRGLLVVADSITLSIVTFHVVHYCCH